jgi:hypothetical protein
VEFLEVGPPESMEASEVRDLCSIMMERSDKENSSA